MTPYIRIAPLALLLLAAGCGSHESSNRRQQDANTPAGKVGQAAHTVVKEAEKAARVAGREVDKAAHQAEAGWKEADKHDKEKRKP